MKGRFCILMALIQAVFLTFFTNVKAADYWQAPYDSTTVIMKADISVLSLDDALKLVASKNPSFKSFDFQVQAARQNLRQSGFWSNPEIEMEIEELGWNAPGLKESEFTVSFSQELELFGQRSARKKAAKALIDETELQVRVSAFDLYLKIKERYYALAHAQQKVILNRKSLELIGEIVDNINYRLNQGAALKSELLLANLEEQHALLELDQAKQDVISLEAALTSLWKAKPHGVKVALYEDDEITYLLDKITTMSSNIDSTRDLIRMQSGLRLLYAERELVTVEARPTITLRGGFKRFEVDNSKSFLVGISLPFPLFNRNQGTRKSLDAQLQSMKYDIEQEKAETQSRIESITIQLTHLKERHTAMDTILLPTAQDVYQTLKGSYDAGRIPYTQILEAKRILIALGHEHNNIILEIQQQIIELERITGTVVSINKEN